MRSPITTMIKRKSSDDKSCDEKWDELLERTENKIENWREEKTNIGPEPLLIPSNLNEESAAQASIYADDNSVGEKANDLNELKDKTKIMLDKVFEHMRAGRLLVNSDKTKILVFAMHLKRACNDLQFTRYNNNE